MQPDDEAPLTLSKWPFYLGDILLVVTALAIAILGEWQLSDIQVVSCVLAVALGSAIFVLPYVVEYSMRVHEERDDRSSEPAVLKGHMQKAEASLGQCHERLIELESGSGSDDQRYELLASAVDHKLHAESQNLATLSQQVAVIETFMTESVEALGTIESRLVALEETAKAVATVASAETTEPEAPSPARAPRQRRKQADSGLLHRAIKERQDSASSAVSRIIDSKSQLVDPEPEVVAEASPEPEPALKPESASVAPVESKAPEAEELVVELDPTEASEGIEALPEDIEVSLGADLIEDDELLEAAASDAVGSADAEEDLIVEVTEVPVTSESESGVQDAADAAEPADLFGDAVPAAARRARTKANDAILTVSILIGIGNKPFLRGSGGGLSWETGVPMDFEEIGKWRWVAPADLEGPVEVQVYRNDEDADRKGRHTLELGQKLEVSPVF